MATEKIKAHQKVDKAAATKVSKFENSRQTQSVGEFINIGSWARSSPTQTVTNHIRFTWTRDGCVQDGHFKNYYYFVTPMIQIPALYNVGGT